MRLRLTFFLSLASVIAVATINSNHFRKLAALGSAVTVHSGDNGWRHLCNATDEEQTPRKTTRFCGRRRLPHSRLRTPVPDVAGGEPHLEQVLLDVGAGVLEQQSEVPEHAHIGQSTSDVALIPLLGVDLEDGAQDAQVESLGIRMTSREQTSYHLRVIPQDVLH